MSPDGMIETSPILGNLQGQNIAKYWKEYFDYSFSMITNTELPTRHEFQQLNFKEPMFAIDMTMNLPCL